MTKLQMQVSVAFSLVLGSVLALAGVASADASDTATSLVTSAASEILPVIGIIAGGLVTVMVTIFGAKWVLRAARGGRG